MTAYFFFDKVLVPGVLVFTVARGLLSLFAPTAQWSLLAGSVLGPLFILLILVTARRPKEVKSDWKAILGIVASFAAPCFFQFASSPRSVAVSFFTAAASLFYFAFGIAGYAAIGRNLGVIPSRKNLVFGGAYTVVRHPIYASYILATIALLLAYPAARNVAVFAVFLTGLLLRIRSEENLLAADPEYREYAARVPRRLLTVPLVLPLLPLLAVRLYGLSHGQDLSTRRVIVQTAFPVLSLNPLEYDDWASVFVGNHIYPRLFPETDREWIPSIAKDVKYQCLDSRRSPTEPCHRERLLLKFQEFKTCQGKQLTRQALKEEMLRTLAVKNWILPGFRVCRSSDADLCLEYSGIADITKRMQNVYFRFGWSAQDFSKDIVGVAPYCFKIEKRSGGAIVSGSLIPASAQPLPEVRLVTSDDVRNDFNVALFGGPQLLRDARKNVDLITPLAYYVVSNPSVAPRSLPWNFPKAAAAIRSHLMRYELIHEKENLISRWMPEGSALQADSGRASSAGSFELALPDYLPDCKGLATELHAADSSIAATCLNTTAFIEERVRAHKKPWFGFLTPLSPGAPGRTSVVDQYFSSNSSETWLGGPQPPAGHL